MDTFGPPPDDKLAWAFMASFERWVIAKGQEYQKRWDETRKARARLEQFMIRYRTDPAFDQDVLRRLLSEHKFLAHRKVMIDAILTSVLDEDARHGTIKVLTSTPVSESRTIPREKALGGRYTDRQIRTILTDEYDGIARQPETRAGREAPYRTPFTPDDYAPEHLERFRRNLERQSRMLDGRDIRERMRTCDDYRRVRPEVVRDLRTFRDQVIASLQQLEATGTWQPGPIRALRQQLLPCHPLLTIFYDHLMITLACIWFEQADLTEEPDFIERPLTHWFTLNDAKHSLAEVADLTQNVEAAYLYGTFTALALDRAGKIDPAVHIWTALAELPEVPDRPRAVAYHNRSMLYLKLGAFRQAVDDLRASVALFEKAGDRYQIVIGLKCEAEARHRMGERPMSADLYRRALAVAGELTGNDRFGAYWNLACSHRRIGDLPAEAAYLDACVQVLDAQDDRRKEVEECLSEVSRLGVIPKEIPLLAQQLAAGP